MVHTSLLYNNLFFDSSIFVFHLRRFYELGVEMLRTIMDVWMARAHQKSNGMEYFMKIREMNLARGPKPCQNIIHSCSAEYAKSERLLCLS